ENPEAVAPRGFTQLVERAAFSLRSLFRHRRNGLAEVELVGETSAEDVVLQIDVQVGRQVGGPQDQPVADAGRERRIARDPDVEIFAADRRVVGQRIFDAAADRPAAAPVALQNRAGERAALSSTAARYAQDEFGAVNLHPGPTAGHVE